MKMLSLEIFDPTGVLIRTHHFNYEAGTGNRLVLTTKSGKQLLDYEGRVIESEEAKDIFFKASKR